MINIIANFVGKRLQQDWGEEVFFSSVASLEEVPTWPQGNSKHTSVDGCFPLNLSSRHQCQ